MSKLKHLHVLSYLALNVIVHVNMKVSINGSVYFRGAEHLPFLINKNLPCFLGKKIKQKKCICLLPALNNILFQISETTTDLLYVVSDTTDLFIVS